jgi:hypothetical protein
MFSELKGKAKNLNQIFRKPERLPDVFGKGDTRHKLIPPKARQRDSLGEYFFHAGGGLEKKLISHGISQALVDMAEAVQPQKQYRQMRGRLLSVPARHGEAIEKKRFVGEPGEMVVQRLMF